MQCMTKDILVSVAFDLLYTFSEIGTKFQNYLIQVAMLFISQVH